MFDTYQVGPQSVDIHSRVTVEERRAPTDESVRLLREMEDAARRSVERTIRIDDTPVKMVVHSMADHLSGQDRYVARYRVGGKDLQTEYRHDTWRKPEQDEAIRGFINAIAQDIAVELLATALRKGADFRRVFGC